MSSSVENGGSLLLDEEDGITEQVCTATYQLYLCSLNTVRTLPRTHLRKILHAQTLSSLPSILLSFKLVIVVPTGGCVPNRRRSR